MGKRPPRSSAGLQGHIVVLQRCVRWGQGLPIAGGTGLHLKCYHRWIHPPATLSSLVNTFRKVADAFLSLWGPHSISVEGRRHKHFFLFYQALQSGQFQSQNQFVVYEWDKQQQLLVILNNPYLSFLSGLLQGPSQ